MSNIPEQYQEVIEIFVKEYFGRRKWQIENNFLIMLPTEGVANVYQNWDTTPLAHQLAEIARAAAGQIEDDSEGFNRGTVYEGIQDLMEQLFAPPGLGHTYTIPRDFWDHPLGQMVARAFLWIRQDELITMSEASEILGITLPSLNRKIKNGHLIGYPNPDAPNRQKGGVLVSKKEVEALKK